MRLLPRLSLGLIGRIFAVLLLTVLIEYAASTWLYERARDYSIRDDEAHRLAEHLVIARKLVSDAPRAQRPDMSEELTTNRYVVDWREALPPPPPVSPSLDRMFQQIVTWEPELARSDLRLRLSSPGRDGIISGGLRLPDRSWLYFRMRAPLHSLDLAIGRLLMALAPAVGLILIGGLLLRQMLRPMRRLAEAAERIGHDEVESVPEDGPAEVRRVIVAFNGMQARISKLIADRTEALAAVGHDFRTPLARLRLRAETITDPATREALHHDLAEMGDMVDSLLTYLGGEEDGDPPVAADLAVLVATVVDNVQDQGRDAEYEGPDHLEMAFRPLPMKRAVVNLVENALHYGGVARVAVIEDGDMAIVRVDDDGPGIPDAMRQRVLEPFVRLDRARSRDTSGFGLGLPIVVRAVEAEGGSLSLENRSGGGLRAEIRLPRKRHGSAAAQ